MRPLTPTRAYWGPFIVGVMASLVLWGLAQTPVVTGDWLDLVWLVLILVVFGAASAVVGGLAHAGWGGALAGLAGLLIANLVSNVVLGDVFLELTPLFATFLIVTGLVLGVPYLAGYGLTSVVQRSSRTRRATPTGA